MTTLRRVVCAKFSPDPTQDYFRVDETWKDTWFTGLDDSIDALPEVPVHPDYPRLPFVDVEGELDDLRNDMADRDYWRNGGW